MCIGKHVGVGSQGEGPSYEGLDWDLECDVSEFCGFKASVI